MVNFTELTIIWNAVSYHSLHGKCPNTEFFLVRSFPHSDWIRRDTEHLDTFHAATLFNQFNITALPMPDRNDSNNYRMTKIIFFFKKIAIYRFRITNSLFFLQALNVQWCKLYNKKYMIASTPITNSEIFVFIAVLVFKLLSREVLFINRKDNKINKK